MTRSLFAAFLLAAGLSAAAAQPLMPDHLPVGASRPLEAGERLTLAATRLFLAPSLADSFQMLGRDREAVVLGSRGHFYQVRLEKAEGASAREGWVYRSELELVGAAPQAAGGRSAATTLTAAAPARVPAAGDTLVLAGPLLYAGTDLLGEHDLLPGRQVLHVLAAEDARGFLKVSAADGRKGWLHRAELAEDRRRPR